MKVIRSLENIVILLIEATQEISSQEREFPNFLDH